LHVITNTYRTRWTQTTQITVHKYIEKAVTKVQTLNLKGRI